MVCQWYTKLRPAVVRRMLKMLRGYGKVGLVVEADEACVCNGPVAKEGSARPHYKHRRIIALLQQGARQLFIEEWSVTVQPHRKNGKGKTMSGGPVTYNNSSYQQSAPPPLSIPEGKKLLEKHFKGGILSADSAKACSALINTRHILSNTAKHVSVVHWKAEFVKRFPNNIWGGTQYMDGFFGNLTRFLKPKHIRHGDIMSYVRELRYRHATKYEARLVALGQACLDY